METLGMMTGLYGTRRLHDTAQFDRHLLSNGIAVWLQKPIIQVDYKGYLGIFFNGVGSIADPQKKEGLSHFLEHMLFCGSKGKPSRKELVDPILEKGGDYGGTTGWYHTKYSINLSQEELQCAAQTLFEVVADPLLSEGDMQIEREVILQEYRDDIFLGNKLITKHGLEVIFGKDNALFCDVLGTPESIWGITIDDLCEFFHNYYHAGNAQIICGGSFSFRDDAIEILENVFGKMRSAIKNFAPIRPYVYDNLDVTLRNEKYGKDAIDIIFPLPFLSEKDDIVLDFIVDCLGEESDTSLFRELRSKRGLVYSYTLRNATSPSGQGFSFYASMNAEKFIEAKNVLFDVLRGVTVEDMLYCMHKDQLGRKSRFRHPIDACKDLVNDLVFCNRHISRTDMDTTRDNISIKDVFRWRDYLLAGSPLVIKYISK